VRNLSGDHQKLFDLGPCSVFTLGMARVTGATRAIVVGGPLERLDLARAFGAHVTIRIHIAELTTPEQRTRAVLSQTPGGIRADAVFGCVGLPSAWPVGIGYLRDGEGRFRRSA